MNAFVELITIGNELLSGRTLNSHGQTLGAALTSVGLSLVRDTTIPDEMDIIQSTVRDAFERVDIVVVSGGLGPTSDDITRDALADLLGRRIVMSPSALEALRQRLAEYGRTVTPASERMALILEGAETLINPAGAAAAERLDLPDGKTLFIVPGPPNEFAAVTEQHLVPWLILQFPDAVPLELRVLTTTGIGESDIVTRLEAAGFHHSGILIGFYPGGGRVEIRLSAPKENQESLDAVEQQLRDLLHDHL